MNEYDIMSEQQSGAWSDPSPKPPGTAQRFMTQIAALYVETNGCYFGLPNVDPWDQARDARNYAGPHRVVAHPPCKRWGRFHHGSTRKPHQFKLGADGGCFYAALWAVRTFGGVLEHPADSKAWPWFDINLPPREGGWIEADDFGGWTCCVSQGHYGHLAGKRTWLYAVGTALPDLRWGDCEQRLHPVALAKHGYEKARRIGMMAMVGGKDKEIIRDATPIEFRDLLIAMVAPQQGEPDASPPFTGSLHQHHSGERHEGRSDQAATGYVE